jgi:hypothetical protein
MQNSKKVWIVSTAFLGAVIAVSVSSAKSDPANNGSANATAFCGKLQPKIQSLVTPPLALSRADDSGTDSLQAGDSQYVDCDFRQQSTQVDVSLHDDSDKRFDDAAEQGYAALAGFGDRARYSVQGAMGMRWVDVVRGSTACEARLTMEDGKVNGDWRQAAGKMCDAAFASR